MRSDLVLLSYPKTNLSHFLKKAAKSARYLRFKEASDLGYCAPFQTSIITAIRPLRRLGWSPADRHTLGLAGVGIGPAIFGLWAC